MKKTILGLSDEESRLKAADRRNPRKLNFISFEGKQIHTPGRASSKRNQMIISWLAEYRSHKSHCTLRLGCLSPTSHRRHSLPDKIGIARPSWFEGNTIALRVVEGRLPPKNDSNNGHTLDFQISCLSPPYRFSLLPLYDRIHTHLSTECLPAPCRNKSPVLLLLQYGWQFPQVDPWKKELWQPDIRSCRKSKSIRSEYSRWMKALIWAELFSILKKGNQQE